MERSSNSSLFDTLRIDVNEVGIVGGRRRTDGGALSLPLPFFNDFLYVINFLYDTDGVVGCVEGCPVVHVVVCC